MQIVVKELAKMLMQNSYLPMLYKHYRKKYPVRKGMVLFADAHHDEIPFSMQEMYRSVKKIGGTRIYRFTMDFQRCGYKKLLHELKNFMALYAQAEHVFICDNFLPVSSCSKRGATTVTQLWHSGGILKKSGYDCKDSVPTYYKGNIFANYDLWTVSADACVDIFTKAMHQEPGIVQPLGVSRTDIYFSEEYNAECRRKFYEEYPEAHGKKIVLWAPTFRGNAGNPVIIGEEMVDEAFSGTDYFLVKKLHPHYEQKHKGSVSCSIPCEELFPVADLLITDYSSVVFDYLLYKKPFVFFAPDEKEYLSEHGCYLPYNSYPTTIAHDAEELKAAVEHELNFRSREELEECCRYHMGGCDGKSTERILEYLNIINGKEG